MAIVELQYLKDEDRITFSYTRDNKSIVEGSISFLVTPGYRWENTKCEFNFDKDNKLYIDEEQRVRDIALDMRDKKVKRRKVFLPEFKFEEEYMNPITVYRFTRKDGTKVEGQMLVSDVHGGIRFLGKTKLSPREKHMLKEEYYRQ